MANVTSDPEVPNHPTARCLIEQPHVPGTTPTFVPHTPPAAVSDNILAKHLPVPAEHVLRPVLQWCTVGELHATPSSHTALIVDCSCSSRT